MWPHCQGQVVSFDRRPFWTASWASGRLGEDWIEYVEAGWVSGTPRGLRKRENIISVSPLREEWPCTSSSSDAFHNGTDTRLNDPFLIELNLALEIENCRCSCC